MIPEPWIIPPTAPSVPSAYPAPSPTPPVPPGSLGASDATTLPPAPSVPSAYHGMSEAQARAMAILLLLPANAPSAVAIDPTAKRSGASRPRYDACAGARTIAEYATLHTAYTTAIHSSISTRADLAEGLRRGDIRIKYMVARGVVGSPDVATARLADRVPRAINPHEGLHRLSRLEPTPLPGIDMPSADPPPLAGNPRTHTECYARGAARVHSALVHNIASTSALAPTPEDDWAIPDPHPQWEVPPSVAIYAAPVASQPVPPKAPPRHLACPTTTPPTAGKQPSRRSWTASKASTGGTLFRPTGSASIHDRSRTRMTSTFSCASFGGVCDTNCRLPTRITSDSGVSFALKPFTNLT